MLSRKKVIIRRFTPGLLSGYLPVSDFRHDESLDLLDLSGRVIGVPLEGIKMVSFVRDFNTSDMVNPERLLRKTFIARPRTEGLWVRIAFTDDDILEGLAPLDISLLDEAIADHGIQIMPPDVRGNVQRIFIPRPAMASLQVLAVVTTPTKKKQVEMAAEERDQQQKDLFSGMVSTRLH
ncbi:MAG: hypothetical protein JSS87_12545 [Acidobacteria bacterium]|nr:hypothetical protein [Acidobacteriota bacterium]